MGPRMDVRGPTLFLGAWRSAACVILRVSALVEVVPELRELDLNPVKVLAPGKGAVVVDGRMRIGPPRIVS